MNEYEQRGDDAENGVSGCVVHGASRLSGGLVDASRWMHPTWLVTLRVLSRLDNGLTR